MGWAQRGNTFNRPSCTLGSILLTTIESIPFESRVQRARVGTIDGWWKGIAVALPTRLGVYWRWARFAVVVAVPEDLTATHALRLVWEIAILAFAGWLLVS